MQNILYKLTSRKVLVIGILLFLALLALLATLVNWRMVFDICSSTLTAGGSSARWG